MSYDISLLDPDTGKTIIVDAPHSLAGGTYAVGGTTRLWLNVTYNYAKHFVRVFGNDGIRAIYGLTGAASMPLLAAAAAKLNNDIDADYWKATEGNARRAIENLHALAKLAPHGIWGGD